MCFSYDTIRRLAGDASDTKSSVIISTHSQTERISIGTVLEGIFSRMEDLLERYEISEKDVNIITKEYSEEFRFLERHAALYKQGFLNGYSDSVAEAGNDNGTYGPKNCKRGPD